MIPLKDDNPTSTIPYVTIAFIVINCVVHFYQQMLPGQAEQLFVYKFGLIPAEISSMTDLTPTVAFPVWLSPITSMFLHGDLMHLGGNMLFLWIFGNNVEDYLGHVKYFFFYIIAGLAAVAMFVLFSPKGTVPLVGASGAIAGILGAYIVVWPRARVLILFWILFIIRLIWVPAVIALGLWFALQLVMAVGSIGSPTSGGGIAWFAHVGGFAFGYLVLRFIHRKQPKTVVVDGGFGDYRRL